MRIKILLSIFLFCGVAGHAQTIHVWERPAPARDTVHKHWHSYALNKELTENVKDSAYKYWKLQMIWQDSVSVYKASPGKYPAWVGKYYERQEAQYNRKSIYYKEKQ